MSAAAAMDDRARRGGPPRPAATGHPSTVSGGNGDGAPGALEDLTAHALICRMREGQELVLRRRRGGPGGAWRFRYAGTAKLGEAPRVAAAVLLRRDDGTLLELPRREVVQALPGVRMAALDARRVAVRCDPGWTLLFERGEAAPPPPPPPASREGTDDP